MIYADGSRRRKRSSTGPFCAWGDASFGIGTVVTDLLGTKFLHRLVSQSAGNTGETVSKSNFTDATAMTPHAEDIYWLGKTGISQGYKNSDGSYRFGGSTAVYRQDMAAFLHRLSNMLSS